MSISFQRTFRHLVVASNILNGTPQLTPAPSSVAVNPLPVMPNLVPAPSTTPCSTSYIATASSSATPVQVDTLHGAGGAIRLTKLHGTRDLPAPLLL